MFANELPDPGVDAIKIAQNLHWPLDASGFPSSHGLQLSQNLIKALTEIGENVVSIG
jgi:hypothetical protein